VEKILEDGKRLGDDPVGLPAFDIHHEADPAALVLEPGIVQALSGWHSRRHGNLFRVLHPFLLVRTRTRPPEGRPTARVKLA
jgi:hypothetical protein